MPKKFLYFPIYDNLVYPSSYHTGGGVLQFSCIRMNIKLNTQIFKKYTYVNVLCDSDID
jgi:hypothetical protein